MNLTEKVDKNSIFKGITLNSIKKSKVNEKLNEVILNKYEYLLGKVKKSLEIASFEETEFNRIINFYLGLLQTNYSKKEFEDLRFNGKNHYDYIFSKYVRGEDVLDFLRKNEINIIKEHLNGCKDTHVEKLNKTDDEFIVFFSYVREINKNTNLPSFRFKGKYNENREWNKQFIIEFIDVPDIFYFKQFLNRLIGGIARKLITDLNFEDFTSPYAPLFKSKYITRGIAKDVYDKLIAIKAITEEAKTLFIKGYTFNKIEWTLIPKYTFGYFFSQLPIELLDDYYVSKGKYGNKKLITNYVLAHFTNISQDNYYDGTPERIKKRSKKDLQSDVVVKLDEIINSLNESLEKY